MIKMNPIIKRIHERFLRIELELKLILEDLVEYEKSLEKKEPRVLSLPKLPTKFYAPSKITTPPVPLRYPPKQNKELKPKGDLNK